MFVYRGSRHLPNTQLYLPHRRTPVRVIVPLFGALVAERGPVVVLTSLVGAAADSLWWVRKKEKTFKGSA